jgi:dihydrofolate synthase/folylpolyglutamate synthase
MYSRIGAAAYKADLTNTLALCAAVGNPHHQFKSIHVGGTNGKGSVSHMLASVLQTGGYKTGLYTSPHLYDFRERIRINGAVIEESFVTKFTESVKDIIESINPSFFEITVAMAFRYFANQQVDVAVVEVGLGGRLDSTNILLPEASVITNIGWDHTAILGNTLEQIASEKAGIIKKEIPVVIGERDVTTEKVFIQQGKARGSAIFFASDRFTVSSVEPGEDSLTITVHDNVQHSASSYTLDLPGLYQAKNICTLLQTVEVVRDTFPLGADQVVRGLATTRKNTGLHGRWEQIASHPRTVLDVAHNEPGILELARQLERETYDGLHIVFGMVRDKEVAAILELLPRPAHYYFTQAHIPRALDATELQAAALQVGLVGQVFSNVDEALRTARSDAAKSDLVLVCGSIFLIAEVNRDLLQ